MEEEPDDPRRREQLRDGGDFRVVELPAAPGGGPVGGSQSRLIDRLVQLAEAVVGMQQVVEPRQVPAKAAHRVGSSLRMPADVCATVIGIFWQPPHPAHFAHDGGKDAGRAAPLAAARHLRMAEFSSVGRRPLM